MYSVSRSAARRQEAKAKRGDDEAITIA